jgi:serine/threonine protein kinase/tetratricopeptide (TPR) repeat protein
MKAEDKRVCQVCGTPFPASSDFCPVCVLRGAIGDDQATSELAADPTPPPSELRFGHYQVLTREDGKPFELGRGAMGVTYKAFDVDLQCPAALKIINARYLGDESARQRFVREARAAASVRHPNVASVFHLGKSGGNYFYAMEFVEGETLEHLIKLSGHLEVKLAFDIVTQVAAGLAAVNKQNLVHRDIKPSNIMVSLEEGGAPTVKIIDLGLAKPLSDSSSQAGISVPGAFVGTPAFASPEQFAGSGVDIRSDLYSLGVVLWQMLAGQTPFRGSSNEVRHQHQHAPLPLEELRDVPQQAIALIEVLLEKNPARRFETPAELLMVLPMVKDAIETGRRIMKTIRVFVSSTGDVQKERNLANRVIRSIAAEFDLSVSDSDSNFQRLAEANAGPANDVAETEPENHPELILCPFFWEYQSSRPGRGNHGEIPNTGRFDLVLCIVWSRLGYPVAPMLTMPDGSPPESGTEYEIAWALDRASKGGGVPVLRVYRNCSKPTPPLEPKEEREAFGREWDCVQEFFAHWEKNGEGGLAGKVDNYHSLEEFEELFRERFRDFLAGQLEHEVRGRISGRKACRWKSSPFRGLNVFDFEHAPIFYGRTKAIGEVLEALEEQLRAQRPFVLVVGASGSGKSSLVRAGVLPLLTQPGTIEGIGLWRWAVTRPGAGGSGGDCFDALAAALLEPAALPALEDLESLSAIRDLAAELREHPDAVALRVRDALDHAAREWKIRQSHYLQERERRLRSSDRSDEANLVREQNEALELPKTRLALVVDQLEELFTSGFSPNLRQKYISAIAGLVRSGRVFILAALRSDFYSSYQEFPELIDLTRPSGKIDLRPPTAYEIGNMIRLPAEAAGLRFEQDRATGHRLDEAVRDAAATTPESLPLLEHVLSLLYDVQASRGDHLLRWLDYRELGELKGALAKHAETVFGTLQPDEQKAFPLVMRYLVTLGQGEEEVPNRRTVPYRDFVAIDTGHDPKFGAKGFVDLFIEQRLLVADTDPQGEVTVSVAHEALLREWHRVKEWLIENREFLRMRDRLDSSLKLWLSRGKQKDDLLGPGLHLAEGEKLVKDFGPSLSRGQNDYVSASIAEHKRRQRIRERIRYGVMAGITAALIVAVIFGVVSFRQYKRAERAKVLADRAAKRATLARNDAGKLINYMTIDLRDKLKPIGRLDLLDDVNQRVLDHYASLGSDSDSPDILSQWSVALVNSGDIQKDRGDLAGALKSYSASLTIRERLAQQNPGKNDWQRYRALGIANVGDVLNLQGDSSRALERYETALNILQDLGKRQSGNADLGHDLSAVEENIGQVLEKRGDLTRALKSYQDCLAIRQELKKQEPDNIERDHDISLALLKIGSVLSRQGSLADAVQSYRDSLAIQQKLADGEPTNAMWQQELASSKEQFGKGLSEKGDLVGALEMQREALEMRRKLTERDPSNATWQRMLARSYSYLSDVLILRGNLADGLENCQHALQIRDMLAKRDPSNAYAQRDLAIANDNVGKVLELQGNEFGAKEKYNGSLSLSRKLAAQDPNNAEWQRDLSISLERVGTILSMESDFAAALDKEVESLAIRKKLASRDESNAQWQNDLSWSYISVGDLLYAKKDLEGALTNYRTAQGLERELVQRDSRALELQSDLAVTCQNVGDVLRIQGQISDAFNSYRECVALSENLVSKDPTNGEWASELALACYSAATTLPKVAQEPNAEARTLLKRGRDILMKLQTQSALSPVDEQHLREIQAALGGP